MASKKPKTPKKTRTPDLPGVDGPGVSAMSIPEIDKAAIKYEREKDRRCEASPGEIAAKRELTSVLIQHSAELPLNEDGKRFYRFDGVDYIVDSVLKRRKCDNGDSGSTED